MLYQLEFHENELEEVLADYWARHRASSEIKDYANWLVRGVFDRLRPLDEAIQEVSERWRLPRMTVVDRNILRLAAYELEAEPHLEPAIVINEAVEIAKKYSGEEAAHFVNGILDALRKRREAKLQAKAEGSEAEGKGGGKTEEHLENKNKNNNKNKKN